MGSYQLQCFTFTDCLSALIVYLPPPLPFLSLSLTTNILDTLLAISCFPLFCTMHSITDMATGYKPRYNPSWLSGLKTPTNKQSWTQSYTENRPDHCIIQLRTPGNRVVWKQLTTNQENTCPDPLPFVISESAHAHFRTKQELWPYPPKWVTLILFMKFWFLHICKVHSFSFQIITKLCKSANRFKSYYKSIWLPQRVPFWEIGLRKFVSHTTVLQQLQFKMPETVIKHHIWSITVLLSHSVLWPSINATHFGR